MAGKCNSFKWCFDVLVCKHLQSGHVIIHITFLFFTAIFSFSYPDEMFAELWRIITEILELARSKNQPNMLSLQATIFEVIFHWFFI